ncbi:aminoglycoside phosphotransferase family protein [Bacillus sp. 2205SS5-2]|uniref:aminoglycoside phosphotransferase family protein n=1 Tax=Bacillus sp. 2205SS5-2 TaxID=3109031 RepID=UPI00300717A2
MISSDLKKTLIGVHGEQKALKWVKDFPRLASTIETTYEGKIGTHFELSYHFVAPFHLDEVRSLVIKAGVPSHAFNLEVQALKDFACNSIVRLFEEDSSEGWMLIEHLTPGYSLREVKEEEKRLDITARLLQELWRTPPERHSYPLMKQWASGFERMRKTFDGGTGPLPASKIEKAEKLFRQLLHSTDTPTLLHGDLHHGNILYSERRGWIAIDAKGVVGDPASDLYPYLSNELLNVENPLTLLQQRIAFFSFALTIDPNRIIQWGFARSVLSAVWCVEDQVDCWKDSLIMANLFETLNEH